MHQIGAGVLGPVFRAYHPPHDRPFAVKAFHIDITPEQAETLTERFGALVAAGSFHPAAVPATAVGVDDGVLYLAQEYVAGESLDAVMRDYAPAALEKALSLIDRLAGAIDAAHAHGVRHGGLHLRDIFVTPSGCRVTGFGVLAALEEVGVSGPIRRPYTAPETIARRPWGPAADRFALAAVAYELLTGKRAAGTGGQVVARLAALDEIEDVESLQAVFETALADGPDGRYASAARFAADLHAAVGAPFEEEALELAPPPLPAGGADPAPAAPAERPEDREVAGEAAAPAAEIVVDLLPGATERAVEDDGRVLDAEPAAGLAGAEPEAAAWEAEPDSEPGPALQIEPEARVEPQVRLESEPQPDLQPEPALELEPEPDPDLAPEPRSPAPSLLAEAALEREIAPEPEPEPAPELDLEEAREGVAAPAPPAAGFLGEQDLVGRLDDPDVAHDADWAGEATPAAGDDVPYRPWASGSVLAIGAALTVGAVAAYLVGLQLAGDQGLEDRRAAGPAPAPPETRAAGAPARAAATVAPPPRAAGVPGSAPPERALAPEPVRTPPAPPPAPRPAPPAPPALAEAAPPPFEAAGPPPAAAEVAPPAAPAAGWLLVRSEPPGATVTVDGVDRGRTPLALSDMPFDTYRVEVSREGFRSEATQLALTPAATVASIQIELQQGLDPPPAPVVGALRVESRPPGATVVIDGRAAGTTPTVVSDVAAGTRSVRLELAGYRPWETTVDVPASDQVRVGASLDLLSRR